MEILLEPIFEADFHGNSYAYRPEKNAQQAIGEIAKGLVGGRTEVIDIPEIFIAYVVSILPIIPTIFLSILISQLSKSSSSSVMLSVLIYIIIMLITILIPSISSMIFISYVNWYKLFIGAQMPIKSILVIIGLFLGYSLVFFSGAYALFEKREY